MGWKKHDHNLLRKMIMEMSLYIRNLIQSHYHITIFYTKVTNKPVFFRKTMIYFWSTVEIQQTFEKYKMHFQQRCFIQ